MSESIRATHHHTLPPDAIIQCVLCKNTLTAAAGTPVRALRPGVGSFLRASAPDVVDHDECCRVCVTRLRTNYVLSRLQADRGALTVLETEVAKKAADHGTVAANLEAKFARESTRGQRLADAVARIGGSWPFVIGFFCFLIAWMAIQSVLLRAGSFDPYPYILLNLMLSCLAAIQAPIIMMSQNRSASRDRAQADQDFRVNLKSEIEITALHEKVDHLLHAQWESLIEVQQTQIDLLEELTQRKSRSYRP